MSNEELKKEIKKNASMQVLFTIESYIAFCKREQLKASNYKNLKRYYNYCLYLTYN